jgi:hypothetical protein
LPGGRIDRLIRRILPFQRQANEAYMPLARRNGRFSDLP